MFSGDEVVKMTEHKHLGMNLDNKLNFQIQVKEAILKARRNIGLIQNLSMFQCMCWIILTSCTEDLTLTMAILSIINMIQK